MSDQTAVPAYVVVVKAVDVANQGIGTIQEVLSAETLEVAVDILNLYAHTLISESMPTFRDGELLSVSIMASSEWTGKIDMRAEELFSYEDQPVS